MYEPEITNILQKIIKPGDTCVEVGACCGEHTTHLSNLVGGGKVVSIEPSSHNKAHIDKLQLPNVTIVGAAASDFVGDADLYHGRGGSNFEFNLRGEDVVGNKTKPHERVKVTTIDELLGGSPCDVMLIDVEGHAGKVLKGASKTVKTYQPYLVLEVHDNGEWEEIRKVVGHYKFYNLKLEETVLRSYFTLAVPLSKSVNDLR